MTAVDEYEVDHPAKSGKLPGSKKAGATVEALLTVSTVDKAVEAVDPALTGINDSI